MIEFTYIPQWFVVLVVFILLISIPINIWELVKSVRELVKEIKKWKVENNKYT